jgi:hypothetical protein
VTGQGVRTRHRWKWHEARERHMVGDDRWERGNEKKVG